MQIQSPSTLPDIDTESADHSARVVEHIASRIDANGGDISFASFMQEALYAPGLGYYSAGARKFGPDGDFTTAPEVSSLFGYVLARQCAEVFGSLQGAPLRVLEFGAGSGKLAADMLHRLADLDALPDEYLILEVSPDLQERQATYLRDNAPQHAGRVRWLDEVPEGLNGVVIANEVLDALPVERFVRRADHIAQLRVANAADGFVFVERPAPQRLTEAVLAIEDDLGEALPAGFVSEVCLPVSDWVGAIANCLHAGMVFLFDYGVSRNEYYAPDRDDGWLRCHFRHHAHSDPLILPGVQDLTAWVDYSGVADAALAGGLSIDGFVSQAHFLMNGGLAAELAEFAELPPVAQLQLSAQVKLLTLPGEMGENFKCLGASRGLAIPPTSFATLDRTITL